MARNTNRSSFSIAPADKGGYNLLDGKKVIFTARTRAEAKGLMRQARAAEREARKHLKG